uniref:Sulfite exporter TauE/SafE family protein 4 n=1 Tax=Ananas comosus var. bracteatus TaxID=296719 RepID=A0A6V7NV19_ANACO|nr:unnamed protein product [Ananas comosus var. bracteatus]
MDSFSLGIMNSSSCSKGFVTYLVAASSIAIASAFYLSNHQSSLLGSRPPTYSFFAKRSSLAMATVIGFLGSGFALLGGVWGGGIFVPMLNLVVGFDTKSAAALSKCMIMGASASSVWYNLQVSHPTKEVPIIDYNLAFVIFPYWLITVLTIILFMGTSSRSFFRGIQMWKQETILKLEREKQEEGKTENNERKVVNVKPEFEEPLLPQPAEKSGLEVLLFNIKWKGILVLIIVWCSFLLLQILKNGSENCSSFFWVVNILQFPVALSVFVWEAVKLWRESRERRMCGNSECVCEASIEWTGPQLLFCALCGLLGGTVGGLLGSGGGFILGPLLLEIGVIPQVASATATFVMMFSASLSVFEFYFLRRFPIPYGTYDIVNALSNRGVGDGRLLGQFFVRKLVKWLGRASIIVFILSSVIFASALMMGVVGTEKTISMIKKHEYMGFLNFCEK